MKKLNQIITSALVALSFNCFAGDCPALSGNYTIGKNATADFSTVSDAVQALQCGGISSPVTFTMENGTYNEKVVIPAITGASVFNTVTFQSKSGVNTDVVISYGAADATLQLNGASYVSFENISIGHDAAIYGNAMRVDGKTAGLHFTGVIFDGVDVARTGANSAVVYFTSNAPKIDISFENCEINNGSTGIFKGGSSAQNTDTKTIITGTLFYNQFETALTLSNENAPVISNNVITSLSNYSDFKGIYLNSIVNGLTISKNNITIATGSTGIEMHDCTAQAENLSQVNSNSLSVGGKDEASGIILTGTTDNLVLNFNRVKLSNGVETTNQAYYRNNASGNNINMLNNVFFDLSTGNYTVVGNTYSDVFNQMPAQSNSNLMASANGLMIEKVRPVK